MSELQNPLFDEEKEFLERKKLEYERALRGDVEHIKDQSKTAGKLALVGAGLAGSIWLITKAFKRKKRKHNPYQSEEPDYDQDHDDYAGSDPDGPDYADETGPGYYTAGNGKRYKSKFYRKSAADSAKAFLAADEQPDADDLGFGSAASSPTPESFAASKHEPSAFDTEDFENDPFQDLPYDDSRRLPASHAFDGNDYPAKRSDSSRSRMIGSVLQAFLQSDTGKVLMGQVAAVGLALVTKKVSEFFPAAKNSDLAAAPAETGFLPVASLASPDSPDASTHSPSL